MLLSFFLLFLPLFLYLLLVTIFIWAEWFWATIKNWNVNRLLNSWAPLLHRFYWLYCVLDWFDLYLTLISVFVKTRWLGSFRESKLDLCSFALAQMTWVYWIQVVLFRFIFWFCPWDTLGLKHGFSSEVSRYAWRQHHRFTPQIGWRVLLLMKNELRFSKGRELCGCLTVSVWAIMIAIMLNGVD